MFIKQISIFVENSPGKLYPIIRTLGENNVDIRALSLSDTSDFGILRLIVSEPEQACAALKEQGFAVRLTEVLAIGVSDAPGGLATAVQVLSQHNINIEYMYAFVSRHNDRAYNIMRVEDNEQAAQTLAAAGITLVQPEDIYTM